MDCTRLIAFIFFCFFLKRTTAFPLDNDDSDEEDTSSTSMCRMGRSLVSIPRGSFRIASANFAYNRIRELPSHVLYVNSYRSLRALTLSHNRISRVHSEAFTEAKRLATLDLSSNNLSVLDANTFRHNQNLEKLDFAFNSISFDPERPFLRSHSVQTLILSHNNIIHVYDITFARLPGLTSLLLDGNPLYYLARNCFVHQRHLQYLSLANTHVYRLTNSMFRTVPRLVDLTNTTLSKKFEPPLKRVRSAQLTKLMDIEKFVLGDDDYETNK